MARVAQHGSLDAAGLERHLDERACSSTQDMLYDVKILVGAVRRPPGIPPAVASEIP
jgi:hypothetical protein